jgi:hypothetical protein
VALGGAVVGQGRRTRHSGGYGAPRVPSEIADPQDSTASAAPNVSDELERWARQEGSKTLGSLIELFGPKGFALVFVLLLGVPALPVPTGGATHVFEIVAVLLALQLIVGREEIWLPERWRKLKFDGPKQQKFLLTLIRMIRWLERFSRPRFRFLFDHRLSDIVFGLLVAGGSVAAFVAPPFTALDTLPALGVVLLSLSVLLEDFAITVVGLIVGVAGVALEILLGAALINQASGLL